LDAASLTPQLFLITHQPTNQQLLQSQAIIWSRQLDFNFSSSCQMFFDLHQAAEFDLEGGI